MDENWAYIFDNLIVPTRYFCMTEKELKSCLNLNNIIQTHLLQHVCLYDRRKTHTLREIKAFWINTSNYQYMVDDEFKRVDVIKYVLN